MPANIDPHQIIIAGLDAAEKAIANAKALALKGQYAKAQNVVNDVADVLSDLGGSENFELADQIKDQ